MRKHIILSYIYEGEDKTFDFDTSNQRHQERIIATVQWAARKGVEIYISPKINVEAAIAKQSA